MQIHQRNRKEPANPIHEIIPQVYAEEKFRLIES